MTKVCVFDMVRRGRVSACLLFFSSLPLSFLCTSVHPHFPLCAPECFVYFWELGAQVTFSRRKQCSGIPGNFLPLVSLNTEVYISQNQSGFSPLSNLGLNMAICWLYFNIFCIQARQRLVVIHFTQFLRVILRVYCLAVMF